MDILQRIGRPWIFCITLCISVLLSRGLAQETVMNQLPSDNNKTPILIPVFTEREADVGSTFLVKKWIRGVVELANHKRIPEPDQLLLFNFDKIHNQLYVINLLKKVYSYPIDSVSSFELVDNDEIYSFEKIPWISNNYFLMPVTKSEKGYSLYKRLFTKLNRAEYSNAGYYTTGKKYDEYLDYYEYYLIFPGNTSYRKIYLKENAVRRVFRDESKILEEFFALHDNEINEESLLGIVQYINDKKYPE